jgi:hypothetical protein
MLGSMPAGGEEKMVPGLSSFLRLSGREGCCAGGTLKECWREHQRLVAKSRAVSDKGLMPTIDDVLTRLSKQLVRDIKAALVSSSISEILEFSRSSGGRPRGPRPAQPEAKDPKAAKASPKGAQEAKSATRGPAKKPQKVERRSTDEVKQLIESVTSYVNKAAADHPDGVDAKQIASALRISPADLTRPLSKALKAGKIAKKGERNQSRYLPKKLA